MAQPPKRPTKIIAFVGLAGAGKSSAVDYLRAKEYPSVYFGGVVLDAMNEAGVERNAQTEKQFREQLREKEGKDFIVNRIISQINGLIDAGQHRIIADGIYSWTEYKKMKRAFPGELTVIAIVAARQLRHRRLAQRPERPFTAAESTERDWNEIEKIEKGGPIAIADHFIINNGGLAELEASVDTILEDIKFY